MPEQDFEKLLAEEKKKVAVLEQRLQLYEKDAIFRGYFSLNRIVNQQVDILNGFSIKDRIDDSKKESAMYDRVQEIWTKLPAMITNLNVLKTDLNIKGDELKDQKDVPFIETIAEKRS